VAAADGLTVSEDGSGATFTVRLADEPTADVTIGLASTDTTEGVLDPQRLTFTPAAWDTALDVVVTGVDDHLDDGDVAFTALVLPAVSDDPRYDGVDGDDVALTNGDDDEAGFFFDPTAELVTDEFGGSDTFTVRLTSEPRDAVVVELSCSDATEGRVVPGSLTWTAGSWGVEQRVEVVGVNDGDHDGDISFEVILSPATSADPAYAALDSAVVAVINLDRETGGCGSGCAAGVHPANAGWLAALLAALIAIPGSSPSSGRRRQALGASSPARSRQATE